MSKRGGVRAELAVLVRDRLEQRRRAPARVREPRVEVLAGGERAIGADRGDHVEGSRRVDAATLGVHAKDARRRRSRAREPAVADVAGIL